MKFYIKDNSRLDFKNSRNFVIKFMEKRLAHFGYSLNKVINDEADLEQIIGNGEKVVLLDIMSPIFDPEIIEWSAGQFKCEKLVFFGAVPGTAPIAIWGENSKIGSIAYRIRWETQAKFNNQMNLYKYKRLKMFIGLVERWPEIVSYKLDEIEKHLCKEDVFNALASYMNEDSLIHYDVCPYCDGTSLPVPATSCQSMVGFIPQSLPLYFECQSCKLVYLTPRVADDRLHKLYDDFDYEDFRQSVNNPYDENSSRAILDFVNDLHCKTISTIDLGGGVGKFSALIKTKYPTWDVTHSDFELKTTSPELSKLGVKTKSLNFIEQDIGKNDYSLVTMWEVIEHIPIEKLGLVFSRIRDALMVNGYFVFSTPDFSSELCFIGDFFNVASPFHLTCFTPEWIERFVQKIGGFEVVSIRSQSDLVDDWSGWLKYLCDNSPGPGARSIYEIISSLDNFKPEVQKYIDKTKGTEFIMVLRKVAHD